jgi:hypothetical protein
MDLRGFTTERRGCIFELSALINQVPMGRVVLLTDRTTDLPLLRETVTRLWATMDQRSPNARGDSGHLRVIEFTEATPAPCAGSWPSATKRC